MCLLQSWLGQYDVPCIWILKFPDYVSVSVEEGGDFLQPRPQLYAGVKEDVPLHQYEEISEFSKFASDSKAHSVVHQYRTGGPNYWAIFHILYLVQF